jgi:CRISPR-associated endoribonuclease Cas6
MELKISFTNPNKSTRIPIDYQYYLSSWMYGVIAKGNSEYALFLHNEGYKVERKVFNGLTEIGNISQASHKIFKLYNFSNLIIPKYLIHKEEESIEIISESFELKLRFAVDKTLENFIKGLFVGQTLTIKTGFNQMSDFPVNNVELLPLEIPESESTSIRMRALSPIVISKKRDDGTEEYLSPDNVNYENIFFNNLIDKFIAFHSQNNSLESSINSEKQSRLVLPNPKMIKSKLINIYKLKGEKPIKVKGYQFDFSIEAPKELIEIGLLAGFGKDNAMGFGCVEILGKIIK